MLRHCSAQVASTLLSTSKHNNLGNGNNDIGLIYMNARFYVPSLARFASADTVVPDHTNPQDWNRFSYVRNSPFNYTDPTGHAAQQTRNGGNCATAGNICTPSSEWGGPVYPPGHPEAGQSIPNPNSELDPASEAVIMIASFVPGVGEVIDVIDIASAVKDGNYDEAAFILAIMALPGSAKVLREGGSGAVRAIKGVDDDIVQAMMRTLDNLCSFSEDTLVMTEEGLVPISEVDVGELVLAFNEATGEIGYYPVTATWAHLDPIIVELTIDGEVVWTTPEHPFYTADGDWEAVFELQVGEEIQQADGTTGVVEGVVYHARPQMMYNMTVATAHTYFVGDGQWLVHNSCPILAGIKWPSGIENISEFGRDVIKWGTGAEDATNLFNQISFDSKYIRELAEQGVTSDIAYNVADWYHWAQLNKKGGLTAPEREMLMRRIGKLLEYYE